MIMMDVAPSLSSNQMQMYIEAPNAIVHMIDTSPSTSDYRVKTMLLLQLARVGQSTIVIERRCVATY